MKRICLLAFVLTLSHAMSQIYDTNSDTVQTLAGSGFTGYLDGQAMQTMWNGPQWVVADTSGNLYVWDSGNARIRRVSPTGAVSTFAGGGGSVSYEGYGTNMLFPTSLLSQMVIDHLNTILMAVSVNGSTYLLRIGTNAYVSIEYTNLPYLSTGSGLAVDSANNLYYSDATHVYRYYPSNHISEVFVGSGNVGQVDGNGIFCSFAGAGALAVDAANNVYVYDNELYGPKVVRRVNQNRDVVTIAGGSASLVDGVGRNAAIDTVSVMCMDTAGNIIFNDGDVGSGDGIAIRKITPATNVVTMAGSFSSHGYANGPGYLALFNGAFGLCVADGTLFVADFGNQRIRQITFNPVPQPVSGGDVVLNTYAGLQISGIVGRAYQIQSSPDMSTWRTEATILLTSSPYLWIDQSGLGRKKFYRTFLLP
jgi:hypothetical protein